MSRIIVKGGLGNQMFQYALFMAIKSKSKNPKLDISIYKAFRMHNGFEINKVFNIELSDKELVNSTISNLSHRTISKFNLKQFELTDTLIFNPEVFTSDKLYINGYWQSELYFKDIEEIIRKQFTFKTISQENKDIAEEMRGIESVAIHIRRGDYVGTKYEHACPKEYYSKAVDYIMNKSKIDKIYVFSDDVQSAATIINDGLEVKFQFIDINNGNTSYQDMYLMTQCKHNIIANSSFSWWGAWLNANPNKIVVAPKWLTDFNCRTWHVIEL